MLTFLKDFLSELMQPPFIRVFGVVFVFVLGYCHVALAEAHTADRARLERWLTVHLDRADKYRRLMASVLTRLSAWAKPVVVPPLKSPDVNPVPTRSEAYLHTLLLGERCETAAARVAANPFGWPILDFALRLAIAYPLGFAILQWIFTGEGLRFGWLTLFEPARLIPRIAFAIAVCCLISAWAVIADLATASKFGRHSFSRLIPFAMAAAVTVAATGALAGVFSGAAAATVGATFAAAACVAGASMISGAMTIAIALSSAGAAILALTGEFALAVASAGAIVFAVALIAGPLLSGCIARGAGSVAYATFLAFLIASLCAGLIVFFGGGADNRWLMLPNDAAPIILFLGLFPLINAVFDYFSYGLTLTLVRRGLRAKGWHAALYGLVDLVAAAMIFTLLGATLTAFVVLLNRTVDPGFFPLAPVFDGAAAGDPTYLWLGAMLFSTFVPTIVHLALASVTLTSAVPQR